MLELEQPFALDIVTKKVRRLPKRDHRDYRDVLETEFYGTADLIGKLKTGLWCAADYKSGQNLGAPKLKYQLRFFAACIHLMTGTTEPVVGRFIYIAEDSTHSVEEHPFTRQDTDETISNLEDLYRRIVLARQAVANGEWPELKTSEHCFWCSRYAACPAKAGLVKKLLPELATVEEQFALLSPEQMGMAYDKLSEIKTLVDRVEKILKDAAKMNPLPLPSGKVLGPIQITKKSYSQDKLILLSRRLGATDDQIENTRVTSSYPQVRELNPKKQSA